MKPRSVQWTLVVSYLAVSNALLLLLVQGGVLEVGRDFIATAVLLTVVGVPFLATSLIYSRRTRRDHEGRSP